ncbi:MAG: glycine betaine ABC transporter substrate-binding protein [Planctomycetaceae bacterium]
MTRWILIAVLLLAVAFTPLSCERADVRIGSKQFTESVILGEVLTILTRDTGKTAVHHRRLGGTELAFAALRNGDIDAYVDYTGTIRKTILSGQKIDSDDAMRKRLREDGIVVTGSLGFRNNYELGMNEDRAAELGIKTISDLTKHPQLRFGFSNEFIGRPDGWKPLRDHYGLPQTNVRGLDHAIAYRQIDVGAIDVMDVYTTDAKIKRYGMRLLKDDRAFFPRYDAVLLYRAELEDRAPDVVRSLRRLVGQINERQMLTMNVHVSLDRVSETVEASRFVRRRFGIVVDAQSDTRASRIAKSTLEHLDLVRKSLIPAILIAIPLGVFAAKRRRAGRIILATVGIVQTVPALALLVFLIAPVNALGLSSIGRDSMTAVTALFLYSLLPIVRNTYAGLKEIESGYHESAIALGLPPVARLRLVELPMASRTILEGIKTAAVINVGFATLGALIGAGGYGQPIITGIQLVDTPMILEGAIPAAVLALLIQGLFDFGERFLVPRGLRLQLQK